MAVLIHIKGHEVKLDAMEVVTNIRASGAHLLRYTFILKLITPGSWCKMSNIISYSLVSTLTALCLVSCTIANPSLQKKAVSCNSGIVGELVPFLQGYAPAQSFCTKYAPVSCTSKSSSIIISTEQIRVTSPFRSWQEEARSVHTISGYYNDNDHCIHNDY